MHQIKRNRCLTIRNKFALTILSEFSKSIGNVRLILLFFLQLHLNRRNKTEKQKQNCNFFYERETKQGINKIHCKILQ